MRNPDKQLADRLELRHLEHRQAAHQLARLRVESG